MTTGWRMGALGDFIELKRGYDLPQQSRRPGSFPVISSAGPSDMHAQAMVRGPGVVTGRYGTLGKVFFVATDYWPLNTTLYVKDFKGNDPKFISYFLQTVDFLACSDKAAVPGVNRNHLHLLSAVVPPLPEQRAIARILGALDDKIELNRRTNETLEAMARALFKSWFVDFDPVRAKVEGRAPAAMHAATAALFPSRMAAQAATEVPYTWHWGAFQEIAVVEMGASPDGDTYNTIGVGTPLVNGPVEFGDRFTVRSKWTTAPIRLCRAEDLVFCVRGSTTGRTVIADGEYALGRGVAAFRSTIDATHFVPCLVKESLDVFLERTTGSVFPNLSGGDIKATCVLVPPAQVQLAFSSSVRPLVHRQNLNARESETLAALRDALLPRLLSGELRVRDAVRLAERAL